MQHGDDVEQVLPSDPQVGVVTHTPPVEHESPVQQGDEVEQVCPLLRHIGVHTPPVHVAPPQQSAEAEHAAPAA